ncbi:MAG TPA: 3-hydroxyacyl-CoA dehydrogenase NAD-binding domain-containing protein [Solirubrobacteraceae bacterium]|nr:3-hydroxyacyl-CoA dehydrogenase NAD-binding domain-containing protein [Solirubrobacteraceae bacterium]
MPAARVIGVLGAGTMGAGIAQLACRSGARTLLYDPERAALERGVQRVRDGLVKDAAHGRLGKSITTDAVHGHLQEGIPAEAAHAPSEESVTADAAAALLEPVDELAALAPCELVIEAAPERLELKHELYARLSEIVSAECVLASNTSSLLVTAIAAAAQRPERVVGMHFFNPAPVMRLLEVVAGEQSGEPALELARATGNAMGKRVIRAADGPGFIVNRCNRPFGLEALRMLNERLADVSTIDRICRMSGGFRMGPFELMDLVGIDTGLEISRSFYEQSFYEPRWRPSPISARYVSAGLHGRKTGHGYYDYSEGSPHRPEDPAPPTPQKPEQALVVISGQSVLAQELRAAAAAAGYEVSNTDLTRGGLPALIVECEAANPTRPSTASPRPQSLVPRLLLCAGGSLATLDPGGASVGFHALPPFAQSSLVELTRSDSSSPAAIARAERFFAALGKHTVWVGDAPGLVLGRIVCQVINESAFALNEGVGDAADIDTGMELGLNYPHGPFAWAEAIGLDHVLAVLDALNDEYREERYRATPALRRLALATPHTPSTVAVLPM